MQYVTYFMTLKWLDNACKECGFINHLYTVWRETLAVGNVGKFGELLWIRQCIPAKFIQLKQVSRDKINLCYYVGICQCRF